MLWELLARHSNLIWILILFAFAFSPFASESDDSVSDSAPSSPPNTTVAVNASANSTSEEIDDGHCVSAQGNFAQLIRSYTNSSLLGDGESAEDRCDSDAMAEATAEANASIREKALRSLPVASTLSQVNNAESVQFMKWAADFFPRHWSAPTKERFLKIVGVTQDDTCTSQPDPLDFSTGWQARSILYLYQSNKTRLSCASIYSKDSGHLSVIPGYQLQDVLNDTASNQVCTVVFFYSGTCPYCYRAAPVMHSAAVYFPEIRFLAVDTDRTPGVAGHYGIMGVPVVVLFYEKRFITGWTIPKTDARDTIRAFIMAYTDVKYIPHTQNITGLNEGILSHFELRKQNSLIYMISNIIVLAAFAIIFWKRYLLDAIKKALDRAGVNDERLVLGVQQPNPLGDPQIPVPQIAPEVQDNVN
ncbi:uncharacterized protein LOC129593876 [Paramacrobiotus metropolitanus]|uniref:uncharacterized protein LOC129593876 n=1 Tax=Paramacrobiotus metropolitanus TaxID=2943436 RepID=UPI0024456D65|nr:uncharacterized protein LOC129593876 [Paramacrobiotus metropolitanus]